MTAPNSPITSSAYAQIEKLKAEQKERMLKVETLTNGSRIDGMVCSTGMHQDEYGLGATDISYRMGERETYKYRDILTINYADPAQYKRAADQHGAPPIGPQHYSNVPRRLSFKQAAWLQNKLMAYMASLGGIPSDEELTHYDSTGELRRIDADQRRDLSKPPRGKTETGEVCDCECHDHPKHTIMHAAACCHFSRNTEIPDHGVL